jgi:hypothetical protein
VTDCHCPTGRWHCAKCGGTHPDKGDCECPGAECLGDAPDNSGSCCPLRSTVIREVFRPRIRPADAPLPKSSLAGFQEAGPPGSLPSRKPPPGGRPAQPVSGGLPPFPRPIDLSCWDVAVAADRLKRAGKKEDHVRRLFAMMIEAVYLSTEDLKP